jgi:hypothetical protein
MRRLAATPLCHFSSFVILSCLLAAVLRAFKTHFFIFLPAFPVILPGWQWEAVAILFWKFTQLCLYKITHVIACFFVCSFGVSVLRGHPGEALSQFAQSLHFAASAPCS